MEKISLFNQKYDRIYPFIVIIGTGGTGTYMTQMVAQMLSTFDIKGNLVLADPDLVEEKNLKNQLFVRNDIGKPKAAVLARRYSAAYEITISHYSNSYIEDTASIKSLFKHDYCDMGDSHYTTLYLPIIIGCVDNNYTRQVMHQFFQESSRCVYIDVGNDSVKRPQDHLVRTKENWTEQEMADYVESGWSGQVVCGMKLDNETILPPLAEVFPDVLEDKDEIAPSQLSCSNIAESEPQRVLTNRMAAMSVAPYVNQLLADGTISNHMTFFHSKEGYMKSQ